MAPERGRGARGGEPGGDGIDASAAIEADLERLAGQWAGYWRTADAAALARDVRGRLEEAVRAWDLELLHTFDGNAVAVVCAARQAGRAAVLKVSPRGHSDDVQMAGEGRALEFWRSTGAVVKLLDSRDGGFTLLLERLEPGTKLSESGLSPPERLDVLGRLARRLHAAGEPPDSFPHLGEFVPWRRFLAPSDAAELDGLLAPRDDDVLIHLDLHEWNVLAAGEEWKVIDPKGLRADRHAENWALLDDDLLAGLPRDRTAASEVAAAWVRRYSRAAGLDPERVRRWTRLRALAEAGEFRADPGSIPETDAWPALMERIAAALR
ncbi:MAG TPA: aminoglycoside phosphotransferase family protein [Thermoleophilaceae bacterium]